MIDRTIRDIAEAARQSGVTELEIAREGFRIRLRRQAGRAGSAAAVASATETEAPREAVVVHPDPLVRAPMVGYFFSGRRPGDPPCVKPGDVITTGSRIGCVETMGTVTDVTSPLRGTVVEYLVSDGSAVEYGQPVLRLSVDSSIPDSAEG